ncbi:hypothetical protein WL93_13005 [Burkholderia diffusa]|uniref:hypothetical protein n=1 Tax=Burkholderia diffusa TaxID=488732 RepID=UPI00075A9D03|nr:hypothetical protein [Burkholderia diffusa]KWF91967.1 hypothetical protein WL93_13005 [Burkholderia diffusa]
MHSHTIRCPYCHTALTFGVSNCINCSARLEYGIPALAYGGVLMVSVSVGTIIDRLMPSSLDWIGVPIALLSGIGATLLVRTLYRDYVEFRRPHFHP